MRFHGQLLKAVAENLSADPSTPVAGQIYFNTTSSVFKYYTGSAWVIVSFAGLAPAPGSNGNVLTSSGGVWISQALPAGGALVISGSTGAPNAITAAGGITAGISQRQQIYVQGSGGAVSVTANPQISAGTTIGQELIVSGASDTNPVTLNDGTGLSLNGAITLYNNSSLYLVWNGTVWAEISRRPY